MRKAGRTQAWLHPLRQREPHELLFSPSGGWWSFLDKEYWLASPEAQSSDTQITDLMMATTCAADQSTRPAGDAGGGNTGDGAGSSKRIINLSSQSMLY